jgi:hypothetical protein
MDAIWIKGHTSRTGPVNRQHNETDELAGQATEYDDSPANQFPLYDEDFLVYANDSMLIECDVKLAAIQRAAQVHYDKFRNARTHPDYNSSTLVDFTDKLIAKLKGAHNIDKNGPTLTKDPAQHRLIIHTRSNSLPTNTRLHSHNPATFPTNICPLCTQDTDTQAHALWECQKHTERLNTLATTLATRLLNIQDPIADSWNSSPNTPLHLQQDLMNTKWPNRFKIIRTPVIFKKQKEPEDPHKDEQCTNKDNSINLHKLRSINIPGTTGKKRPEPAADFMTAVTFTNFPTLQPIKLSRFWELSKQFKKNHRLFPQALADAIQSETKTLRDTGINVDSSMSWAGDRHLTNILAKWVHTERFSSSSNCNFAFKQSFSARKKDSDFWTRIRQPGPPRQQRQSHRPKVLCRHHRLLQP